ncbi:Laccase abr2 [Penicillium oxalicum]|uniref:Laccase abr2 n=1 Tax=Penicillium oxalicum TaxID=69781 RepID=UPI0020B863B3|nr:Laccase abr2 [Penicillium oxalicum]KAI2785676.1 Laccase abr2 [Penicillium oxalicum]
MDGLYGAIFIRPAANRESPFSMISSDPAEIEAMKTAASNPQLVVLSDWDHLTSDAYMQAMRESGYDIFCSDSVLINGSGSVYCKAPEELTALQPPQIRQVVNESLTDKGCNPFLVTLQGDWKHNSAALPEGLNSGCVPSQGDTTVFQVDRDAEWASFNFISAAGIKALAVSIDEHPLYIYEVDGRYIEPQLAHEFPIYNGERYSAMVISGFATLSYLGSEQSSYQSVPYFDYGGINTTESVIVLNTTHLPPYPPILPAESMKPALYDPSSPDLAPTLKITTKNDTWIDIVFQLEIPPPTLLQPPHPIHEHSNKAFLTGADHGKFVWSSIEATSKESPESFLQTPLYRDTYFMSPSGGAWIAIRYHVENPGAFLLHSHMETHLSSGMDMAILDGIDAWPAAI